MNNMAIEVDDIQTHFGDEVVHRGVSFSVESGSVVALIGGSGSGKSTLLREIIGLLRPSGGRVRVYGTDVWNSGEEQLEALRARFGVMFQYGALFSGLTVGENVAVPLIEQLKLEPELIPALVKLRLSLAGLSEEVTQKLPSELSGGMVKRAALARALALEPDLLFLDEPTSGLDPINARAFDSLVRTLADSLGLTVFMVTHDLDTISSVVDRIIVLGEGVVLADGSFAEISEVEHPWIQTYFSSRST